MQIFKNNSLADSASPHDIEDSYPLSPIQQGMVFHSIYDRHSGVDLEQMVYTLHEPLDVFAFMTAWQRVIDRHAILRTSFKWEGLPEPIQEVNVHVSLQWDAQDWRGLPEDEQQSQLAAYLKEDRMRGFDLTEKTLNRMALFRIAEADYQFIWTFHHAIIDGRSFVITLKEAFDFYEAILNAEELSLAEPRPYRDYIEWQRGQDLSKAEDFWREELKGFASPTPLLPARNNPNAVAADSVLAEQGIELSSAMTAALKSLARQNQVTLNNMVQAAWALLLSRSSGEKDVIFGATRACRRSAFEGADSIVGPLINTLPMRLGVSEDMRLMDWLKRIREKHVALRDYEHNPLMKIQEWNEVPNGRSLFDSILVFENYEMAAFLRTLGESWASREFELLEQTNYPLALSAWAGAELVLKLAYDKRYFDGDVIERMLGHVKTLLDSMAKRPYERIASLDMLTESEIQQLLFDWNDAGCQYPQDACVHQLFEAQAARTPEATAVMFEGDKLSYRELNAKANQLARHLLASNIGPESLVAICMERSVEMIVGLLAILKAGAAYVPLDPAYPQSRLAAILEDVNASALLIARQQLPNISEHCPLLICLDSDRELIAGHSEENLDANCAPHNLAYVICTSGSTGRPKGVMIEHRSVVSFSVSAATQYEIEPDDRVLQFASISFDASAEEIYPCLIRGATLVLRNEAMLASISVFLEKCEELGITVLDLPTAYWHELTDRLETGGLRLPSALRLVIIGGERASPARLAVWTEMVGSRVRLVNTYGPTEATVVATARDLTYCQPSNPSGREVPIGRAVHNARAYILDSLLRPVPIGIPGQLHIAGPGVARGYLGKPDLTAQQFVANPFDTGGRLYKTGDLAKYLPDGNIEFCGRIDNQVKIHGFRIELGEIEAVAAGCPAIKSIVALAREDVPGEKRLVAYIVPAARYVSANQAAVAREVKDYLRSRLPAHMLPSAFVSLEDFPLDRNGKIDRNALPAPAASRPDMNGAYVKPRDPLEYQLVQIWEELFDMRPIGITDNFFDLGGHSLLSVRMMDRIEQVIGRKLPLATLFSGATIENLSDALIAKEAEARRLPLVEIQAGRSKKPFFYLHGDFNGGGLYCLNLARHLGSDQPFYAIQPHGLDDHTVPDSIESMAASHIKTLRQFQPEGPYQLGGHCNGGLIAFEMARQLEAEGAKVELLVVICAAATNARYRQLQDWVNRFCLINGLGARQAQDYFLSLRERIIRLGQLRNYYASRIIELFRTKNRIEKTFAQNRGLKRFKSFAASFFRRSRRASLAEDKAEATAAQTRREKIADAYVKAMLSYVPRQYSGRVTLFWPDKSPFIPSKDATWGWRDVASEVEVHTVPGEHLTCITAHTFETAQTLKRCIDRANA